MRHPHRLQDRLRLQGPAGSRGQPAAADPLPQRLLGAALPAPIRQADILNPDNEREFPDDQLSIVDVKARDERGRLYQVEIQLLSHPDLPAH